MVSQRDHTKNTKEEKNTKKNQSYCLESKRWLHDKITDKNPFSTLCDLCDLSVKFLGVI
jgi:hypothetical protein